MSKWRVGGKVPLNVYEDDVPMFQCHTPEQAASIVRLLNEGAEDKRRLDGGRIILTVYGDRHLFAEQNLREAIDAAIAAAPASKEEAK